MTSVLKEDQRRRTRLAQRAIRLRINPFSPPERIRSEEDRRRAPAAARDAVGRAWSEVLRQRHAGVAWSVEDDER